MFDAISSQASKLVKLTNRAKKNYSKTKLLTITSGKGGVGKSTLTANIAFLLAKRGFSVAILDADIGLANMQVLLDIRPQYTLFEYIDGVKTLDEVITKTIYQNLFLSIDNIFIKEYTSVKALGSVVVIAKILSEIDRNSFT